MWHEVLAAWVLGTNFLTAVPTALWLMSLEQQLKVGVREEVDRGVPIFGLNKQLTSEARTAVESMNLRTSGEICCCFRCEYRVNRILRQAQDSL